MSEQKQSYMAELDRWIDSNVIQPLGGSLTREVIDAVKKAIRARVYESYRNGQAAGPAKRVFTPRAK